MYRRRCFALLLVVALCAIDAFAADECRTLSDFGRGVAIVFSPDLSVDTNCLIYERLGFACYQTPSWDAVIEDIRRRNATSPEDSISVVILETHGTNGNGLKLQMSAAGDALRSYVAIGALHERLGPAGVQYCVLSACNSRRLLRPAIYHTLDPRSDRLFLPATLGIVNAQHESSESALCFLSRADSHVESLSVASTGEFTDATLRALDLPQDSSFRFVVSDLMLQLATNDPGLDLRIATPTEKLQRSTPEDSIAEALIQRFIERLDRLATDGLATDALLSAFRHR